MITHQLTYVYLSDLFDGLPELAEFYKRVFLVQHGLVSANEIARKLVASSFSSPYPGVVREGVGYLSIQLRELQDRLYDLNNPDLMVDNSK